MAVHEVFEQLCALAAAGEVTPEEFRKLQEHLHECPSCRACYRDFHSIVGEGLPVLDEPRTAGWRLDGRAMKRRFVERAVQEGIPLAESRRQTTWPRWIPAPAATVALVLLGWPAYHFHVQRTEADEKIVGLSQRIAEMERLVAEKREPLPTKVAPLPAPPPPGPSAGELELARQLAALRDERDAALQDRGSLKERASALSAELEQLRRESGGARAETERLERGLQQAQLSLARANQDLESLRGVLSADRRTIAEQRSRLDQIAARMREQAEILDRERELLAAAGDIRDLMGARDMRIAEVADIGGPRRRGMPGRVFYSREKLIYYAFDLDNRGDIRKLAFQVWGKREGRSQPPRSLGFLSLDDAGQKRWVLRNEDPALLAQIDQVFVTVEPPGGSRQPTGRGILFASLIQP
ncbi:MAG: hypothetical protein HY820_31705 [Acidobacteria bacterium]|nr:hypothetical protein [Acidobacteriota bacterium]